MFLTNYPRAPHLGFPAKFNLDEEDQEISNEHQLEFAIKLYESRNLPLSEAELLKIERPFWLFQGNAAMLISKQGAAKLLRAYEYAGEDQTAHLISSAHALYDTTAAAITELTGTLLPHTYIHAQGLICLRTGGC